MLDNRKDAVSCENRCVFFKNIEIIFKKFFKIIFLYDSSGSIELNCYVVPDDSYGHGLYR